MVTTRESNRTTPRHLLRARIGHAALSLFRESGFDAVSVDQIVAKAGVSKGAFFNFFPTKADALLVYFHELDARIDKLRSEMDPTRPLAALEQFFVKAETLLRREGSLLDALSRAIWSHPTLMKADRVSAKEDRRAFADFFERARTAGAIKVKDPAVAADAVGDLWTGSILMWLGAGRSYSFAEAVNPKLRLLFTGLRPREIMNGKVIAALMMSIFTLTPARGETWTGLYRKDDGGVVAVGEMHEFGHNEILVDYTTGEAGPLFALEDGRTGIGRAIGDKSPPPARILERKNDGDIMLDGRRLAAIEISRRTFRIMSGAIELAGELVHPKDKAKGVIVFVHGSGDGPRRAYDLWTNFFVSRGWAAVVFDKRGSGNSTGDWHDADFVTLAGDVRSVVNWTRAQKQLAGLKVALWGASQAGWIIPQLTAESAVDFAIVQAGPSTPTDEFVRRTLESELRAYGFPPDEIAKAVRYYDLDVAVSRGTKPFSEIEKAYAEASAAGAEWLLKPPDPIKSPDRRFMAVISGFDPADYWRKTRTPLLVLFGGKDHVVPVETNRKRLEALLAEAGNTRAEIVVFENDNHLNMLAKTGVRTEYASLNRFDPEYFKTLTAYLERMAKP